MSHIHIPDGVLPLWLVIAGWLVTGVLLALCSRQARRTAVHRRLALLGVMSALMLVGMTIELVPIGYHVNLAVISGVVLGPTLGFIAAFIVNLILGLLGHGGITVVGLNTLVIGAETVLGYFLFRGLWRLANERLRPGWIAGTTTVVTLFLSTLLMIGIVAIANIGAAEQAPAATAAESGTLSLRDPFERGILAWEVLAAPEHEEDAGLDLLTFARLVLVLGFIGWLIEAVITGILASYVARIRPDLLGRPRLSGSS